MKRITSILVLGLALTLVAVVVSCGRKPATTAPVNAAKYHCPMHPTVVSDKPGDCPICGMKLVPMDEHAGHAAAPEASMSTLTGLATVSITPEARQRMGLKLGTVEKRKLSREVRTSARIVADETRLHHVTVKTEGWIGELFVAVTGQQVKHGEPLLTVYSPALVSAQEEYLIALKAKDTPGGNSLLAATRRRLELWDITDEQIAELEKAGTAQKYLTFYSHMNGVVLDRAVLPGHKVMPDESLMTIADLSVVWADADIYQSDLSYVKVGMPVEVAVGEMKFAGKVVFVSPTLDPATRTMKARLEIPNPELLLKPGMYGDARLQHEIGDHLAIPDTAVMLTTEHAYAFKDTGDGHLIPTAIKIGARTDGWCELLDGLNEGDQVVISANFLVDSESSMKGALEGVGGAGHQH